MSRKLLAFLAHPDDESFGSGGTLAKYAREGVDVHIVIATDGAAGSVEEAYAEQRTQLAEVRAGELERAVAVLGGTLHRLDYRDSGYKNDEPNNSHPDAFINADMDEAVGKMVRLLREIRPQVVITHDETGGYFHPDHIQCYEVMSRAFVKAGDPNYEDGLAPYRPDRLYYTALPNTAIRFFTFLIRLRGGDPTRQGRNQDIDMTALGQPPSKIHARIDVRDSWDIKQQASAEHGSQGGGGFARRVPKFMAKWVFGREHFMRGHPEAVDGFRETDLFA